MYEIIAKLATLQATRIFQHVPPKPQTPPPFFPQPTAAEASMQLPPLATQALTSHIFVPLPFQRPSAPIADTSTSPPLLVAQAAQALQPFSPNVTKPCGLQPKQARSCLRLQHRPSHVFHPVTSNPFSFSVASSSQSRCQREVALASSTEYIGSAGRHKPQLFFHDLQQLKQALGCLCLQHRPSHVFSPVTPNPLFLPVTSSFHSRC